MKDTHSEQQIMHLLEVVEANNCVSQRHVASEVGIALGMVNTYIQRCVRKGWIKTQKIPARRYAYYLTPQGMTEKTRLVKKYMQSSLSLFREAKTQFQDIFQTIQANKGVRIGMVGSGDLQDIGMLVSHSCDGIEGVPINAIQDAPACDAYILTDMDHPQETYDRICARVGAAQVYPLPLLRIKPRNDGGDA